MNPFLYYFSSNPKVAMQNMDTYGKIQRGNNQEIFFEDRHQLLGVRQDQSVFSLAGVSDLQHKIGHFSLNKGQSLWFLCSRWTGAQQEEGMLNFLRTRFVLISKKSFHGIHIYKFDPLQGVE
jgi:hypothetical protein